MIISNHTIFALSTPKGQGALAIIRISGSDVNKALRYFNVQEVLQPNQAKPHKIYFQNSVIDQVLLIFFKGPKSFTGEDLLEIQSHGSFAVVQFILRELGKIPGFFMATPGEFARRALQNGKMNLLQAEALGDVLNAQTEKQLLSASNQAFSEQTFHIYQNWREKSIKIMSNLEAFLAFPDEEISPEVVTQACAQIDILKEEFNDFLHSHNQGEVISEGFDVAIVGAPNAGKSTLINHLMQREVAIVSEIAGTTRDVLTCQMNLDGFLVNLFDTAGLREKTEDKIEKIGIKKAKKCLEKANLIVFLQDFEEICEQSTHFLNYLQNKQCFQVSYINFVTTYDFEEFLYAEDLNKISSNPIISSTLMNLRDEFNHKSWISVGNDFFWQDFEEKCSNFEYLELNCDNFLELYKISIKEQKFSIKNKDNAYFSSASTIYAINDSIPIQNKLIFYQKNDLLGSLSEHDIPILHVLSKSDYQNEKWLKFSDNSSALLISVHKKKNLEIFLQQIREHIEQFLPSDESKNVLRERHRQLIQNAAEILSEIAASTPLEIISECLRVSINNLEELLGKIGCEDVLDKLFKDFCIGK